MPVLFSRPCHALILHLFVSLPQFRCHILYGHHSMIKCKKVNWTLYCRIVMDIIRIPSLSKSFTVLHNYIQHFASPIIALLLYHRTVLMQNFSWSYPTTVSCSCYNTVGCYITTHCHCYNATGLLRNNPGVLFLNYSGNNPKVVGGTTFFNNVDTTFSHLKHIAVSLYSHSDRLPTPQWYRHESACTSCQARWVGVNPSIGVGTGGARGALAAPLFYSKYCITCMYTDITPRMLDLRTCVCEIFVNSSPRKLCALNVWRYTAITTHTVQNLNVQRW